MCWDFAWTIVHSRIDLIVIIPLPRSSHHPTGHGFMAPKRNICRTAEHQSHILPYCHIAIPITSNHIPITHSVDSPAALQSTDSVTCGDPVKSSSLSSTWLTRKISTGNTNDSGSWHELTWWADGFNEMVTHPDDLIDFLQIGAICLIGRDLAIPTFVNAKMPPRRCSSKEISFSRHFVVSWDTRWHYTVTAPYTPHIHHTHHDSSPEIRLREALWQTYGITVSRRLVHQTEMLWRYMTLHRTGKRPHFIRCLT